MDKKYFKWNELYSNKYNEYIVDLFNGEVSFFKEIVIIKYIL